MKKILVTGGAGFIGLHLAKYLAARDYELHMVDNFSRGVDDEDLANFLKLKNVKMIRGNLLERDFLKTLTDDYQFIFHFAAIIGVANVLKEPYRVLTENVALLENIIQFARKQPLLRRLFFTSTSEVYAGALANFQLTIPTPESAPLALTELSHPRTSYMLSKIYGEAMCQHSGLPYTVVRPHNIYGPRMGMNHVIPELLKKGLSLESGVPLDVFSADHRRSFCYIEDAVLQLDAMMKSSSCENKVLNLGKQGPEITMEEVARTVLKVLGKNNSLKPLEATAGSPARRAPDMSLTKSLIGFEAKVELFDGVAQTYDWYKKNIFSK